MTRDGLASALSVIPPAKAPVAASSGVMDEGVTSGGAAEDFYFTVLTPTFNRAHTLRRLFESLARQKFDSFEWLIVDDGSADGTIDLIEELKASATFPIRYHWQRNRGKHVAINTGAREARGHLVLIMDSDDALTEDALVRFRQSWEDIAEAQRSGFAGVTGLCLDPAGRVIGEEFRVSPLDSDSQTVLLVEGVRGEKCGFIRREVLLANPFPETLPTKFIPEGRIWFQIGRDLKTRFINAPVRVMFDGGHPRLSRISRLGRTEGDYEYNRYALNALTEDFIWRVPLQIWKFAILVVRSGFALGRTLPEIAREVEGWIAQVLVVLSGLPGFLLHCSDMVEAHGRLGLIVAFSRRLPRGLFGPRVADLLRRLFVGRAHRDMEIGVLDFRMALAPNARADGFALFCPQSLDWREIAFLKAQVPCAGVFVDVGAGSGFYTLVMSRHISSGLVVAIEGDPIGLGRLRRNVEISVTSNVTVLDAAGAGGTLPLQDIVKPADLARIDGMRVALGCSELQVLESFLTSSDPKLWPRALVVEISEEERNGAAPDVCGAFGYRMAGRTPRNVMLLREA